MADYYVGEIRAFAGTYAPQDWLICDGSTLQILNYQVLYAVIGTQYGGNGTSNFILPDLRGRLAIGQGAGPGLTARVAGNTGGNETVTLVTDQLPVHNHNFVVSTAASPASVNIPTGSSYLGVINSSAGVSVGYVPSTSTGATPTALNTKVLSETGGAGAHTNLMPFLSINYMICVNGIYPSRQ